MKKTGTLADELTEYNIDMIAALSAKEYFQFYHEVLNRRNDDSLNSRLNYGYEVVQSIDCVSSH